MATRAGRATSAMSRARRIGAAIASDPLKSSSGPTSRSACTSASSFGATAGRRLDEAAPVPVSLPHPVGPQTRIIPMIGHPIAQVKSLAPINAWFAGAGVDACMTPVDVEPARVPAFFEFVRGSSNCIGVSVTLPHKQAAFAACDRLSSRAQVARAVNIMRREQDGLLYGDMTDGVAFCSEIARKGVKIEGAAFLLIGAGGAGSAVAHAMAEHGASSIAVVDIDVQRRHALVESLREHYRDLAIVDAASAASHADVALNATPMGMREDDPLPLLLKAWRSARSLQTL